MMAQNSKYVLFGNRKPISQREVTKMVKTTRIELPQEGVPFSSVTPSKRAAFERRAHVKSASQLM
jgi:hypothetical protein